MSNPFSSNTPILDRVFPGFNSHATDNIQVSRNTGPGVGNLTNKGFVLEFQSLVANKSISFPAFVQNFSDAYTSDWTTEQVFGRMDPIATFSATRRNISAVWTIPAASAKDAAENLAKINDLLSFLYPAYASTDDCATTMNMGPLMRVKFGNLISTPTGGALLGWINGFTMDPIIEDGMFMFESNAAYLAAIKPSTTGPSNSSSKNTSGPFYLPKTIRLNFELSVLHEHQLGFTPSGQSRVPSPGNFPYPNPSSQKPPATVVPKAIATKPNSAEPAPGKRPQPSAPANQAGERLYTADQLQEFGAALVAQERARSARQVSVGTVGAGLANRGGGPLNQP